MDLRSETNYDQIYCGVIQHCCARSSGQEWKPPSLNCGISTWLKLMVPCSKFHLPASSHCNNINLWWVSNDSESVDHLPMMKIILVSSSYWELSSIFSFNYACFVGWTNGEAPEHGWAYLNSLAYSTSEMGLVYNRIQLKTIWVTGTWKRLHLWASFNYELTRSTIAETRTF